MATNQETDMRQTVRTAVVLLILFLLLYAFYNVISVFLGVLTYAIIFSVSFHGPFEKLRQRFSRFKKMPAIIYGVLMVALIALPFIFLIGKLGDVLRNLMHVFGNIRHGQVPALPDFIKKIPILGEKVVAAWTQLEKDPVATIGVYDDQIRNVLHHMVSGGTGILGAGLEIILGIVVSALLLHSGKKALAPVEALLASLVGDEKSAAIIDASGRAIRGVAVGVMGTGLIAALAAFIGFSISGIGIAGILAAITFLLVVVQVGPLLVWLPVALWFHHEGQTGWAIFTAIYGVVVLMGIDNILKPILIGKSGKLPILVLFLGVVGGMAAWGFTGMFKGAIVLAVLYTLIQSWIHRQKTSAPGPITDTESI
jgi:predicted PurR-regulated permease PerM